MKRNRKIGYVLITALALLLLLISILIYDGDIFLLGLGILGILGYSYHDDKVDEEWEHSAWGVLP